MSPLWYVGLVLLLLLIVYPYTIYPALLWLWARIAGKPWLQSPIEPNVTIIIAAYNEERVLEAKLRNTFALDYPAERLEIIVVSDCSSDRTDEIARGFSDRVRLVRLNERSGKQIALNRAVEASTGSVIVFTDASVNLDSGVIRHLVRNFADARVGAVSSVIRITTEIGPGGLASSTPTEKKAAESAYLGLDIQSRRWEAMIYSAVGCCGSCYAIRRACFRPFAPEACNDFASALDAVRRGYRVVVDPEAIGTMLPSTSLTGEFRRKARTLAGGLATLARHPDLPSVRDFPLFWWIIASHKIMRWAGPLLILVLLMFMTWGAFDGNLACLMLIAGFVGFVLVAGVSYLSPAIPRRLYVARLVLFIAASLLASLAGWGRFMNGRVEATWQPTARQNDPVPAARC